MATVYCTRCGRTIGDAEMEDGLVVETQKGLFCGECVPHIQEFVMPAGQDERVPDPHEEPERETEEPPSPEPPPPSLDHGPPDPDEDDDPVALLKRILDEVKPIHRAIIYERASVWNVLGGVAQIFAASALLFSFSQWGQNPTPWLMLAVFLQLATLTFFVKGK